MSVGLLDPWRAFAGVGLAWPWMLLALPLPWLLRRLLRPLPERPAVALKVPFGDRLETIAQGQSAGARGGIRLALSLVAWGMLCLAAARPQQLGPLSQPPKAGRDLMLAVDVSGSMEAVDMPLGRQLVDRLTAAKAVLADFLDRRVGDRVGLIVFGERAFVLTPATLDLDSVRQQLEASVVGLAGRETAIGDAIALAVKRLRRQSAGQRVLILLTDGVSNVGAIDPDKAAQLARDEKVRIYAIALGGAGASVFGIPLPLAGGEDSVDEAGLRRIAEATGGRAYRAADTRELAEIYRHIDRLEPVSHPGPAFRPRIERYLWPLAAALLLASLASAWPQRQWT